MDGSRSLRGTSKFKRLTSVPTFSSYFYYWGLSTVSAPWGLHRFFFLFSAPSYYIRNGRISLFPDFLRLSYDWYMLLMLVMGIDLLASKCEPRTMLSMRRVPELTRPTTAGYGSSSTSPVRNLTFQLFCRTEANEDNRKTIRPGNPFVTISSSGGCGVFLSYVPSPLENPSMCMNVHHVVDLGLSPACRRRLTSSVSTGTPKVILFEGVEAIGC